MAAAKVKVEAPTVAQRRAAAKAAPAAKPRTRATPVAREAAERAEIGLGERLARMAERGAAALSRVAAVARQIEDRQAQAAAYRELRSGVTTLAECAEATAAEIEGRRPT